MPKLTLDFEPHELASIKELARLANMSKRDVIVCAVTLEVARIRALSDPNTPQNDTDQAIPLLKELLAKAYDNNDLCPICNQNSDEGHLPTCRLGAMLSRG